MSPNNNSRSSSIVAVSMAVLAIAAQTTEAFVPSTTGLVTGTKPSVSLLPPLYAEETTEETNSAFMPPTDAVEEKGEGDIDLSTVEMLGKGAAKVCVLFNLFREFEIIRNCRSVELVLISKNFCFSLILLSKKILLIFFLLNEINLII
jgi:hypothetical protein